MAVELKRGSKDPTLSLFYHFESKEPLENISNTIYAFADTTSSAITFQNNVYKPVRIYLTTVLHRTKQHDYELIVEHEGKNDKLFICFALKKQNSELAFPLIESPLEKMAYKCSNMSSLYYKTSTKSHVFFFTPDVYVGDDFPKVLDNAKVKYKEIFEPNAFDIFSNLFTRNDLQKMRVVTAVEGGQFARTSMEGFTSIKNDTFMDCELLEDDENGVAIPTSEYALTPLNANYYERGLVTIVTFLHFLLIIAVGGIALPYFQCNGYPTNEKYLGLWFLGFTLLQWGFFVVSIILLSYGLKDGKEKVQKASNTVKNRRLVATFGLYFLILFLSNAVSMRIMFPFSDIYKDTQRNNGYDFYNIFFCPMYHMKTVEDETILLPKSVNDLLKNSYLNKTLNTGLDTNTKV